MNLIVSPDAQEDVLNAAWFYEKQERGLGERVISFLEGKIAELTTMPGSHSLRRGFYQAVVDGDFPYYVIYYTLEKDDLHIRAIFDHRRDPKKIRRQLRQR